MALKLEALKIFMQDGRGFHNSYYELVDEIVRETMKEVILDLLSEPDEFDTIDNKTGRLSAFCRVLEFYSTPDEYRLFMKELQG
jgi:hypothetical protein